MITDSNQVCFVKMIGRRVQGGVPGERLRAPPKSLDLSGDAKVSIVACQ